MQKYGPAETSFMKLFFINVKNLVWSNSFLPEKAHRKIIYSTYYLCEGTEISSFKGPVFLQENYFPQTLLFSLKISSL